MVKGAVLAAYFSFPGSPWDLASRGWERKLGVTAQKCCSPRGRVSVCQSRGHTSPANQSPLGGEGENTAVIEVKCSCHRAGRLVSSQRTYLHGILVPGFHRRGTRCAVASCFNSPLACDD